MEKFFEAVRNFLIKTGQFIGRIRFVVWLVCVVLIAGLIIFVSPQTQQQFFNNTHQELENLSQQVVKPSSEAGIPSFISSPTASMKILSPAFEPNASIPSQYTCDGRNMSLPFQISDVPADAKSLALIVHDPDAPAPGGFTHWVMWNIPAQTTAIEENTVPAGAVQGHNGAGKSEWTGPCPPSGVHHYQFMIFALDTMLDLPATTDKAGLEKAMEGHTIAKGMVVGLYQRK